MLMHEIWGLKVNNERLRLAAFKCQCVAGIQAKWVCPGMRTKLSQDTVYISPLKRVNISLPLRKMTMSSKARGESFSKPEGTSTCSQAVHFFLHHLKMISFDCKRNFMSTGVSIGSGDIKMSLGQNGHPVCGFPPVYLCVVDYIQTGGSFHSKKWKWNGASFFSFYFF